MQTSKFVITLLLGLFANYQRTKAQEVIYDYVENGDDWPSRFERCSMPGQSPIDLKMKGWPLFKAALDNFQSIYTDQVGDIEIKWTGFTT